VVGETLDGARAYNLQERDRLLVRAFMKGVHETETLKFDRPGLNTTATHDGSGLALENDLALKPSQVIVIHVDGLSVTLTYTDTHRSRIRFLQDLLEAYGVKWGGINAAGADYELSVGEFTAQCEEELERFLAFIGSRLVFLVDWNRARKRLARVVDKAEAGDLLKWAAEHNVGHCAFLQAGGVRLIESVLASAPVRRAGSAARLETVLGHDGARTFLRAVLRITSSGLAADHPLHEIEDAIKAELLKHVQTTDRRALAAAVDHAATLTALAERVRRALATLNGRERAGEATRAAELARTWATRADEIAAEMRHLPHAGDGGHDDQHEHRLDALLREADRATGVLEETAFLLTLIPESIDPQALGLLGGLAELVEGAVHEYNRCLAESQELSPASASADVNTFFVTVERLTDLGRRAGHAKRAVTERLLRGAGDCQEAYVLTMMAHSFERAATILARCGLMVRDNVLSTRLNR
jgi:hypothetical protein